VPDGQRGIRIESLPTNTYVLSIKEGEHDLLNDGIRIHGDTSIRVVIGEAGGTIDGTVVNAENAKIADAIVVAIPDELPAKRFFYRTTNTDQYGSFEIRGIAPGAYHLFAWRELEGAAYRNSDFMKVFQDQGVAVKVESAGSLSFTLKLAK